MTGGLYNPRPVDDVPVNGQVTHGVTSNWAFDHAADYGIHTLTIRKTADQSVNNTIVLVNVDDMLFAVAANEVWSFYMMLGSDANAAADIDITFTAPIGCAVRYTISNVANSTRKETLEQMVGSAGQDIWTLFAGVVICGATAGNIQLQFAQNVAQVNDATILQNSCIVATRLL